MKKQIFGTKEWAASNVNIQSGCPNDCRYCYAKSMAIRHKRKTRENWKVPEIRLHDVKKGYSMRNGTIMFPTSHDITKDNLCESTIVLRKMLDAGNRVLIVSKPDSYCIEELCWALEEFKKQILFRFSIGSTEDEILRFWEPGAPSFANRFYALHLANQLGFETSVSCEPMLDNKVESVIDAVEGYVMSSAIWIGLPNMLNQRIALNCGDDATKARAKELMACFTKERIMELYAKYKDYPYIKWKESIKKIVGIDLPAQAGLDI